MKILTLFLMMWAVCANAQEVPADWQFVILKTAHFDVIVNARQQDLGELYAQKLEAAYAYVNPLFKDKPERTVIILNDKTDITNGYATRIPYSHIMVYPVLPGPSESLSESGDWALELVTHEFTHILTFEPATGFMKYLRPVFGTIVSPNMLLPNWWKEGLAVHIETQVSRGGRLRSLFQDAMIRSFAQKDLLGDFDLAQINEALPTWPEGHRAYLFGSLMWSQMYADKGRGIEDTLVQRHSGRVPYFIETPAIDNFGHSYVQEYRETMKETDRRAKEQIKNLETKSFTKLENLDLGSTYLNHPSISPDGKYMALISVDDSQRRSVKILERKSGEPFKAGDLLKDVDSSNEELKPPVVKDGPPAGSIQRISWFHHSPKIVFDKIDDISRLEKYSDLHVFDLKTRKSTQLTKGLRGREPSVAPNDNDIVFVWLKGGKTALTLFDGATKKSRILWAPPIEGRVSYPSYLDDKRIIFAYRDPLGEENLWVYNFDQKNVQKVLPEFKTARFPRVTPKGLFFTSSNNGVHNLYRAGLDLTSVAPVSHVVTAVFDSSLDPVREDIYVSVLSDHGPSVSRIDAQEWKNLTGPLPVVQPLFADRYPLRQDALDLEKSAPQNAVQEKEDYHSGAYLWPHYWVPYLATSTIDNSIVVQASTSGFDPLKKHIYSLTGSYETGVKRGSVIGSYQNNQTAWPILATTSQITSYLYSSDYLITNTQSTLSFWPEIFSFSRFMLWEIGAKTLKTEFSTRTPNRTGIYSRLVYSDFTRGGLQISPEGGRSAYLGATNYFQNSDDVYNTQYIFGGTFYHSKWLPKHHAVMLKFDGYHVEEPLFPIFGAATLSYMPIQDFSLPAYVMRGYGTGQFVGKKLYNFNAEYRFPLRELNSGWGTDPYFFRRLTAALVADGVSLDGYAYNTKDKIFQRTGLERSYYSVGTEVRLETTLGYVLPLNLILGVYSLQNPDTGASTNFGINLQMGSIL